MVDIKLNDMQFRDLEAICVVSSGFALLSGRPG